METFYSILEIPESATPEEIKQAYRLLLQVWHPDRFHHNPDLLAKAEKKTREINAAFATLSNPASKQQYDEGRPTSHARQEPRKRKSSEGEARTTRCPNAACASVLRVNATTVGIVTCPSCRTTFRYDPERDEKWDIIPPEGDEVFTPARMAISAIVLVFAIVLVWAATAKTKTLVSNKPAHTHTDEHETLPSNASTAETPHERMDPLEPMQGQMAQTPGRAPSFPPDIISDVDLQQLKTLAAQGSAWAQSQLGQLYANGRGMAQDYATAWGWYEKAATQGHAGAQSQLGQLYADGRGVPQDYKKARQWWEQAALQGNAQAQFNLGQLYANGRGMTQDYTTARGWYEKAAVQGHAWAQAQLGQLYANGRGVPQDYATARGWYEKSAAQGNAWAKAQLALL